MIEHSLCTMLTISIDCVIYVPQPVVTNEDEILISTTHSHSLHQSSFTVIHFHSLTLEKWQVCTGMNNLLVHQLLMSTILLSSSTEKTMDQMTFSHHDLGPFPTTGLQTPRQHSLIFTICPLEQKLTSALPSANNLTVK